MQGCSHGIAVNIFGQAVDIDAVNRFIVNQAESMGDQNRALADLLGNLQLARIIAGLGRYLHLLTIIQTPC